MKGPVDPWSHLPVPAGIPQGMKDPDALCRIVDIIAVADLAVWEWSAVKRALIQAWPAAPADIWSAPGA